jgi:hypothetical protein
MDRYIEATDPREKRLRHFQISGVSVKTDAEVLTDFNATHGKNFTGAKIVDSIPENVEITGAKTEGVKIGQKGKSAAAANKAAEAKAPVPTTGPQGLSSSERVLSASAKDANDPRPRPASTTAEVKPDATPAKVD